MEAIAVFADVGEVDVLPVGANVFREELEGGLVGKVAVAAFYALFNGPGALGIGVDEVNVVIGLDDEVLDFGNLLLDVEGDIAEVCDPGEAGSRGLEDEADWVLGIMGNGEWGDIKLFKLKRRTGLKVAKIEGFFEFKGGRLCCGGVGEDGDSGEGPGDAL